MTGLRAPRGADDLDAAWLSEALAAGSGGARVTAVDAVAVGNGNVAASIRLGLTWDRPTDLPDSLVAKVPAESDQARATAAAVHTYRTEAGFYRELADTVGVRRPRCHATVHDEVTDAYAVLLEDLAPAEAGDQMAGCTPDVAATALPELVALHAPRWDDRSLLDAAWLGRPTAESAEFTALIVGGFVPGFLDRYGHRLDAEAVALVDRLTPRLGAYLADRPGPWTLTHGDFRLDNLMFGADRVAVVDWQTVAFGPALSDVAYFVGASLLPDDRRAHEEALVRDYRDRLAAAGVDLGWDACWRDYRRHSFDGLIMAIGASMLVPQTDRSDEMFLAMASRHARQALDLDAESLLPT